MSHIQPGKDQGFALLSSSVKTIPLRRLLREPIRVKRWTRIGQKVLVTDQGKPLWLIQPAPSVEHEEARARAIDEILDERPRPRSGHITLSQILEQSRR